MWDLLLRQMCIELTPKKFPGYSRSALALKNVLFLWACWLFKELLKAEKVRYVLFPLSRFFMPMKVKAKRSQSFPWSRIPLEKSPIMSATKATSSFPPSTTSLPTVRPAQSHCGTCSSRPLLWSAGAATSSATRTTWTRRRRSSLPVKVGRSCCFYESCVSILLTIGGFFKCLWIGVLLNISLLFYHQWTMTFLQPRTCSCSPCPRRSSRSGWAGWSRRFPKSLHTQNSSHAPHRGPPWRFSPASPWGGPVDSSPPARAGRLKSWFYVIDTYRCDFWIHLCELRQLKWCAGGKQITVYGSAG